MRAATPGAGTQTLVNVTRVENFGAQYVHWVEVTMNAQDPEVFRFEQRIIDANRFPRSPFARLRLRLQDEARQRIGFSSTPFPSSLPQAVGIIAWVVNEHHVKTVPGRKTNIADAQWLATLARAGLLRASFIPPVDSRQLRLVARQRQKLGDVQRREESAARGAGGRGDTDQRGGGRRPRRQRARWSRR